MFVQFSDASETTIIAAFAGAQNATTYPNQGTLTASDARWAAYYATLPASAQAGTTPPTTPVGPTLAQQATAALSAGLAITSTSTPALNATYPCDATTQGKLNSMYALIQRAGGSAFPGGLTALPWPTMTGTVTFNSVAEFLAMETAVGDYVLALDLIVTTGAGTLPPSSVTIA